MNVMYDISFLGTVHDYSLLKTGIPRVIEELACQLTEVPDCNLELCSSEHLPHSVDYVKTNSHLKTVRFPHSKFSASFYRKHRAVQRTIDSSSGASLIAARAQRKLMHSFETAAKNSLLRNSLLTLDAGSLRRADIYHSTYLAVPEQARNSQRPQLFLTVYDMIPTLFPEYCSPGIIETFDKILASIGPDTWLLSISEATKAEFCDYLKLDPNRVFVTPLAADTSLFYPNTDSDAQAHVRQKYHIPSGPYVLSLCTIAPHKNIEHVIRSFVRLKQAQPLDDLLLVLAGGKGWSNDNIFREIEGAEALKDSIVVTGYVANEDLAALYSGALAFVFPSLYEGFGLPPLEAMQCGTPVITSNTSSLPEVVGDAGILLNPRDEDGLCQSLLSLYEDAGLRAQMSARSLARAAQFSWKRCAEDTIHAYKTALGS